MSCSLCHCSFRAQLAESNTLVSYLTAETDHLTHDRRTSYQHDKQLEELRNLQVIITYIIIAQEETGGREYHREVQESEIEVVWPCEEARSRIHQTKDSGDDATREKKARKTEAEMDGLCQPGHESYQDNKRLKAFDRAGWRRIVSAAATLQLSGSG